MTSSEPPAAIRASASSSKGSLVRSKGAYLLSAGVPEDGIERGLGVVFTEAERVARFGFTAPELERQKINLLRGIERSYANRESRSSGSYAAEYIRAFLNGEAIPGIEYEFELYQRFVPEITLEEVNEVGRDWISDENRVVFLSAPESEDVAIPTEDDLLAVIDWELNKRRRLNPRFNANEIWASVTSPKPT